MFTQQMHKISFNEDIIIPESLLSRAISHKSSQSQVYYSGEPAREIHVQKKRQPISSKQAQVYEDPPWVERRNWSHTSAFEPVVNWPLPTVIEDPVISEAPESQQNLFAPRPTSPTRPGLERKPTNSRISRVPIFSPRPSSSNYSERPRVGSLWELYDKAKLASIKLHRKTWVQFLFEYGIYGLFAAFVYFVLIGVPLWKGSVYWLYWAMKNKFVFQGGWSIAIGFMVM